ncbi:Pisatin demethylase [Podospora australis]|uniref:Cytochrome P450 monooxygenase ABA1 n=1 Tax=Podospora australis TaxID=1536484 RepID=A0AAN6WIR8_9PEZI|nr:Pisatin demethylase [Podospora australis]
MSTLTLLKHYLLPYFPHILFISFITWHIHAWYRLRHIPGPFFGSFSHLYKLYAWSTGHQAHIYAALAEKYNSTLIRIAPNELISSDPEFVRKMAGARSLYTKSAWYDPLRLDPDGRNLFVMTDNVAHGKLRAKLSWGYSGKENPNLEQDIDGIVQQFVDYFRVKGYISTETETRRVDMVKAAGYFTLDFITKISYGNAFGYLERDEDVFGYMEIVKKVTPTLVLFSEWPVLAKIFLNPVMLRLFGPKRTDERGLGKLLGVAQEVVAERFAPGAKDKQDMLGAFIRHGVTQRECEYEIPFQISAGADTTANAVRGTLLHLAATHHAYHRLQKEMDEGIAQGRISSPITMEEAKQLPYLQAVIYEGLRLSMPLVGIVLKVVPAGGDTIAGHFVPGGTWVGHNAIQLQRRADVYGEDYDVFRPERWLADPSHRKFMVDTVEMLFGHGRWQCLGKQMAFMELNKVFVELLRRYDFQVMYPKTPIKETNYSVVFHEDMWMRVTERFTTQECGGLLSTTAFLSSA